MKVVITGSTGMVGRGVLLECMESPRVEGILLVNRSPLGINHSKVKEVLVKDFLKLDDIIPDLVGYGACFFCAGTSALGKNEAAYTRITYDLTVHFAKTFLEQNASSVFCYVSGAGTDSSERGRIMWARVKGKTENALLQMPFKAAYMFRPGYIQPLKGVKSRTNWYSIVYRFNRPIYMILKHFSSAATSTVNVGKAMIRVATEGSPEKILGNRMINQLAEG